MSCSDSSLASQIGMHLPDIVWTGLRPTFLTHTVTPNGPTRQHMYGSRLKQETHLRRASTLCRHKLVHAPRAAIRARLCALQAILNSIEWSSRRISGVQPTSIPSLLSLYSFTRNDTKHAQSLSLTIWRMHAIPSSSGGAANTGRS